MTTRARLVLADCCEAHAELVDGLQGSAWRRRWSTVVVLLRATLHALQKVDAKADRSLERALNARWMDLRATKPVPQILWQFIDEDRNLILKEYEHRAGQSVAVMVGTGSSRTSYHVNTGPFAGEDPRRVAAEAIEWMQDFLDELDAAVDGGRAF